MSCATTVLCSRARLLGAARHLDQPLLRVCLELEDASHLVPGAAYPYIPLVDLTNDNWARGQGKFRCGGGAIQ
jgi:hypothetical protein